MNIDVAKSGYDKLVDGITAVAGDHIRRGLAYVRERGLIDGTKGKLSAMTLCDIGACLAVAELVETGAMAIIAPAHPHRPAFHRLMALVQGLFLYTTERPPATMPAGTLAWRVASLRLVHEPWWDIEAYRGGDPLTRIAAKVDLTDDVLELLAELLWEKRNVSAN